MRATILDDAGTGEPIVYVPGIDGTGRMTLGLERRLRRRFRVVRLRYEPCDADDYPTLTDSIATCLDAASIPRATLLAESFGGAVAVTVALRHPDRVRALALVNTFCRYPHPVRLRIGCAIGPWIPGPVYWFARNRTGFRLMFGTLGTDAERARFHALRSNYYDRALHRRLRMIRGIDLHPRLSAIRCPVHIFCGDRDRVLPSTRTGREMAADLPHATVRVIEGGGHLVLPVETLPWDTWLAALIDEAR